MTRLLTYLMIMAGLAMPVAAQEAAPAPKPAAAAEAAAGDAAAAEEDDDDDDDEAEAAEAKPAAAAKVEHHDFGPSGIMTRANREDLAPLTLASGKPVAEAPYDLKSGGYYRIKIVSDGSQELALSGGDFFRAIWVNEVVINDIEIRPMGVHSIEFDDAGEAEISFIAVVPGSYSLAIPGSSGDSLKAVFNIR